MVLIHAGSTTHNMLPENSVDHKSFESEISDRLSLALERLYRLRGTRVVWMDQYPTVDFFGGHADHNTFINAEKVEHYNLIARRAFR